MNITKEYQKNILNPQTEIHYAITHRLDFTKFPHEHDFHELMLVLDGEIELTIDNRRVILPENTLALIRCNEIHSKKMKPNTAQANLAFATHIFDELFDYLGDGFDRKLFFDYSVTPMILISSIQKKELLKKLEDLHVINSEKVELIKTKLKILLFDIFTQYFINKSLNYNEYDNIPSWLNKTILEMNNIDYFVEGLPALQRISKKTPEHLCRSIKKHLGITPSKLINNMRLNYASNLLITTDIKVIDICYQSGFNNLSYFYVIFKDKYGYSPNDYRNSKNLNIE